MNRREIQVIGGGLSGLTLGIGLRQKEIPVILHEAGEYPRHKVCGEFIHGRGLQVLKEMGLLPLLLQAGAREAREVAFFSHTKIICARTLPHAALCLDRFTLDALLAKNFQDRGGQLLCSTRWTAPFSEGMVRASGRVASTEQNGYRYYGLKTHLRNIRLEADLEMHLLPDAYVGLCQLEGKVNLCGLFRAPSGQTSYGKDWFLNLASEETPLGKKLKQAELIPESLCAVGGLRIGPLPTQDGGIFGIGDSLGMIAPLTGNGMSIAFETARLALSFLAQWSEGKRPWSSTLLEYHRQVDVQMGRRFAWADRLQSLTFHPTLRAIFLKTARFSPVWWHFCLTRTR